MTFEEKPPQPLSQLNRLDQLCDRFERAWKEGSSPRIEDYLVQVAEAERAALLLELLSLEIDYRRQQGEHPAADEYLTRFPQLDRDELLKGLLAVEASYRRQQAGKPAESDARPVEGDSAAEQTVSHFFREQPGTIIAGRYKLLEAIGQGGMGTVWVAEQTQPVRRKVALKLIKAGMDSRSVLARFEAERQALAVMDHPNIAKVLDGGLTDSGRPYFVMEYVKGVPITEYCEATRLSIRERLELFVQVCQAVQHAHQKGIIHRDLKPSNILVAPYDDRPVPKVIDFGLAKAMHQSLTERTLFTAHDTVLGTPLYMSPEQAQLNNLDIDTRSDLYSLGVLLYELLTGTTPVEKQRFRQAAWDEIRRIIREEEPPRPSTRLSSSQMLPSLAAGRQIEPARLTKLVRGELDWIVMKSLEKDRMRRYETANGFAMDIQRYLAGEPVLAAPPSTSYRMRKFCRKNRAAITTAAAMILLLVAGVAVSTWQAVRATRAESSARTAEQEAKAKQAEAEQQKNRAEQQRIRAVAGEKKADEERQISLAVQHFLQYKLLRQADARLQANSLLLGGKNSADANLNPTIRELLDRAAGELTPETIEANFPNQPLVQAEILRTVGQAYQGVGEYERAIGFLERSAAQYRQQLGPNHADTLGSMSELATAYHDAGNGDLAVPISVQTLKLRKAKLGSDHPDTLASMNNLAIAYHAAGKPDLALPLLVETLKLRKAKLGPDHPDTLASMNNLAIAYNAAGRLDLALPLCKETLKLKKAKLGPDHPDTVDSMGNLAWAYMEAGKLDLALPLFEETLKLTRAKRGPNHPYTLAAMNNLATAYQAAGKRSLALPLFQETLDLTKAKRGPDHPVTLTSMGNLANAYQEAGRLDLALPLLEETLTLRKANLGPDHPDTLASMNNLAVAYWRAKQLDKSIPMFEDTLKRKETKLGRQHPDTLAAAANLAVNYKDAGRLAEALPLLEECYQAAKKYPSLRWVSTPLLDGYVQAGKTEQAAALAKELLAAAQLPQVSAQLAAQSDVKFVAPGQRSSWSPNGKKIVFGRSGEDAGMLVYDIATQKTTPFLTTGKDPAWAGKDGRWIAYVTGSGEAEEIWIAEVSAGKRFRVAAGCMPSWSSDGKTLFFQAFDRDQLMSTEITGTGQFSPPRVRCAVPYQWPDVSLDGKRVAYKSGGDLVIQEIDSGKVIKRFVLPEGEAMSGGWSPDSREFGFGVWNPAHPTPCIILNVETGLARKVEPGGLTMPAWSPDGNKITFDLRLNIGTQIWMIDAEAAKKLPTFKMEAR